MPRAYTIRKLGEGSSLVRVLRVDRQPFGQIDCGTGRDVSEESVADAGDPPEVLWHAESFIDVPLRRD